MEKIIEMKDLRMSFGTKEVLNGINLDVYEGQIIGYIGPNGAGKSTTVKIMLGLIGGYTGEVKIFGENIKGKTEYKKRIGYIPEVADIYDNLTPKEYLTLIGELYGLPRDNALNKARALAETFEIGDVFNARMTSFSKGMKQKVIIISSLLHNPDILFFDEPLSGLDANSVMVFKELLALLAQKGKTVFYSSHIMDVVEKISDRIILISSGNIVADGTFSDLKNQSNEGSLEEIFNDLTGFNNHEEIARNILSIMEGN